jgi:hypothetical protein
VEGVERRTHHLELRSQVALEQLLEHLGGQHLGAIVSPDSQDTDHQCDRLTELDKIARDQAAAASSC